MHVLTNAQSREHPAPKPNPFSGAVDVYVAFLDTISRLLRYAHITFEAIEDYKARGISQFDPVHDGTTKSESLTKLLKIMERRGNVAFLEEEDEHAEAHVYGNAAIGIWGALEVFIDDVVVGVLTTDQAPLADLKPKMRMPVADFYRLDSEQRIRRVIRLVEHELGAAFTPGVGAFEPTLDQFGLGGHVQPVTRRELLELAASRHCLVHRKGIVDDRFLESCPTTRLEVGDTVLLNAQRVVRFFHAAWHYAAIVIDRIKQKYEPDSSFDSSSAECFSWLIEMNHEGETKG